LKGEAADGAGELLGEEGLEVPAAVDADDVGELSKGSGVIKGFLFV
jgi:hypothetical protein